MTFFIFSVCVIITCALLNALDVNVAFTTPIISVFFTVIYLQLMNKFIKYKNYSLESTNSFMIKRVFSHIKYSLVFFGGGLLFEVIAQLQSYYHFDLYSANFNDNVLNTIIASVGLSAFYFFFMGQTFKTKHATEVTVESKILPAKLFSFHLMNPTSASYRSLKVATTELITASEILFSKDINELSLNSPILCKKNGTERVIFKNRIVSELEKNGYIVTTEIKPIKLHIKILTFLRTSKMPNSPNALNITWSNPL